MKFGSIDFDQPSKTSGPRMFPFERLFLVSFELEDAFSTLTIAYSKDQT
jgi:hypothetical protein